MTSEARRKRSNIALLLGILSHVGLTLVALLFLFPFFWMISNALRRNDEVLAVPLRFFPSTIQWQNFVDAWVKLPPDTLSSHVGELIGHQAAELDYRLKVHARKVTGMLDVLGEVKTSLNKAVNVAEE